MLFYRSPAASGRGAGAEPSLQRLRTLTVVALAAYPAGALIRLLAPDSGAGELIGLIFGFGLLILALAAGAAVAGSRLHRIASKDGEPLDEMEMMLRHQALSWSYGILSGALLGMLVYAGIASDAGLWMPTGFDEWNGLFWGAFLYVMVLPTARLAWTMDASQEDEEE